ncbi:MAG: flavodoxin [Ruminococcus sp.]|nr:flavodoxin [Ruminococcus sp.]
MKTAIVYYSMGGNTEFAAKKIAEQTGADLIEVKPKKAYPDKGASKFLWGGKSAVMSEKPELASYDFDADSYERIVFGFPIWASRVTPPIRSFVEENRGALEGKSFGVFVCQAGSGGEKCIERLRQLLGIEKFRAAAVLTDPKDKPSAETDEKISAFCAKLNK